MAEEPAEGAAVEEEQGEGEEEKKLEYCKELSEEQLTAFYEKAGDNEVAVQYLALEVLKLPGFTYEGNIAIILDYFVGILIEKVIILLLLTLLGPVARFAQEEKMSAPHTLLMYQLGMELLKSIKSGFSMKKTEEKFKNLIFRWSVKVKNTNHVPLLTTIELQKIVPFFIDTYIFLLIDQWMDALLLFCRVFQHFRLFSNCFNRESLHWRYYEEVFIETPMAWEPLNKFDTMEEIEQDKATKAAYENEWAEREAERLVAEAKALWLLENPPEPRRPPNNLDEYIDFSVRDKVEEVMKLMQEQYEQRRTFLYGRVQTLQGIEK